MYNYREVIDGLNECINAINRDLITNRDIDKEITLIEIRCALKLTYEWLDKNHSIYLANSINEINEYTSLIWKCISIYDDISKIDAVIYKEEYISEEVCRYIIERIYHLVFTLDKIVKNEKFAIRVIPFSSYCISKYKEFNKYLIDKINNHKIK